MANRVHGHGGRGNGGHRKASEAGLGYPLGQPNQKKSGDLSATLAKNAENLDGTQMEDREYSSKDIVAL